MDLDIRRVTTDNAYTYEGTSNLQGYRMVWPIWETCKFVALGDEASKALDQTVIPHFKLPHPSGLNRKLNDKQEISRLLYRCKKYIYK